MKTLALLLALFGTLPLRAAVISSFERLDPGIHRSDPYPNIFQGGGTPVWSDYTFLFFPAPRYLIGAELVRTQYSVDNTDPDFQLRVTLDVPATVFLLIDNRVPDVSTLMPWVAALGFHDTGDDVPVTVLPTALSNYSGSFPAGDIVLLPQNAPGSVGMYVVAATPSTNIPEPASLSFLLIGAAFCFRRFSLPANERNALLRDRFQRKSNETTNPTRT